MDARTAQAVATLLDRQARVVTRAQLSQAGVADAEQRRWLRRRAWVVVHPGVWADHTGDLTWLQRAWAGVLFSAPAALYGASSLRAFQGPGRRDADDATIHVAVERSRGSLVAPAGVRLHHVTDLAGRAQCNLGPPRMRVEDAVVDVADGAATDLDALAVLAQVVQQRQTTAARILEQVRGRSRLRRRVWLEAVLADVAAGSSSVLEREYAVLVERPHGLPAGSRQIRAGPAASVVYRDVEYGEVVVVELDGRFFHDSAAARDRDADRDLDAALDGRRTVRLTWGQVHARPCVTAAKLGRLLQAHGLGGASPCGPGCPVVRRRTA